MFLLQSSIQLEKISPPEKVDMSSVKRETVALELLLSPHVAKRAALSILQEIWMDCSYDIYECIDRQQVIGLIRAKYKKKITKTDIYKMRWEYLRQLNRGISEEHEGAWPMECSLRKSVALSSKIVSELRKEQEIVRSARRKLDAILNAVKQIKGMLSCQSIQHNGENGCPVCGVIYIGAAKKLYAEAIDRDDGTVTLRPLEFERSLLTKDEALQRVEVAELSEKLDLFERPLKQHIAIGLQNWLCCRLSRRRNKKNVDRYNRSAFYFRVRRLVKMKRYIDELFKRVKQQRLLVKMNVLFKEFSVEYADYCANLIARRQRKTTRIWKCFMENCKIKMLRSKLDKYALEELMKGEVAAKEELRLRKVQDKAIRLLRKRLARIDQRKYICYNVNCGRKVFLTRRRYEIHSRLHESERRQRQQHLEKAGERRKENEAKEVSFLDRLYEYRLHDAYLHMVDERKRFIQLSKQSKMDNLSDGDTD